MKHNVIFSLLFGLLVGFVIYVFSMSIIDSNNKPVKFNQLEDLKHDALTLNYRGHEYTLFMLNGKVLSPVHDAACVKCNGLMIEGE